VAELKKRRKLFPEKIKDSKLYRGFHAKQREHVKQAMPERKAK
jgi:hypothetical protein